MMKHKLIFSKTSKKFLRFLKTEQAYAAYIKNAEKNHFCGVGSFYDFIETCDAYSFIDYAFTWASTVERFEYWVRLNDKWRDLLHKPIH